MVLNKETALVRFIGRLVSLTVGIGATMLCIYALCMVLVFLLQGSTVDYLLGRNTNGKVRARFEESVRAQRDAQIQAVGDPQYLLSVVDDNDAVADWVVTCAQGRTLSFSESPMRFEYALPFDYRWMGVAVPLDDTGRPIGKQWEGLAREPDSTGRALLQLSGNISKERVQLRKQITEAYRVLQLATIMSIAIGMITTILVSLSSTDLLGTISAKLVRILAIVFPALGTATAGVIAFYSPQATLSQSSQTLTGLTNLQREIAVELWNEPPLPRCKAPVHLRDWQERYEEIETVSHAFPQGSQFPHGNVSPYPSAKPVRNSGKETTSIEPPASPPSSYSHEAALRGAG
jgi:hypothetical protein